MKTIFTSIAITTLLLASAPILAGTGHSHGPDGHSHAPKTPAKEITSEEAITKATAKVAQLVEKQKVDASWANIKADNAEKKTFKERLEWVVTFKNETLTDETKRKLYVFLTVSGDYIAANYTGK